MVENRRGLGRGLSALMADLEPDGGGTRPGGPTAVPIEMVEPNPGQPRKRFDQDALDELATSIRSKGLLQPLVVVRVGEDRFRIVAGERRWRAAQLAQLHEVPVVVRELSEEEIAEIAIIENVQRVDLGPVEEAWGIKSLIDRFGRTQEQVASALGKSRSHVTNLLRLLNLPEDVMRLVQNGALTMGHARALLMSKDPLRLSQEVVANDLSVRETERRVKAEAETDPKPGRDVSRETSGGDADTRALAADLTAAIGSRVRLKRGKGESGTVEIAFDSFDQLDTICERLTRADRYSA